MMMNLLVFTKSWFNCEQLPMDYGALKTVHTTKPTACYMVCMRIIQVVFVKI